MTIPYVFKFFHLHEVFLEQSCRHMHWYAELFERPLAPIISITSCDNTISSFATAGLLGSSSGAQTERALVKCFTHVSKTLLLLINILDLLLAADNHVFSISLNDTIKNMAECNEKLENETNEKDVWLNEI